MHWVLLLQADGIVFAGWDELAAQSDWVVFLVLAAAAGQNLTSGCAEQSPLPTVVLLLRSSQEPRCGSNGFLAAVLLGVEDCLSCQRQGGFWATRVVVEQGETEGRSGRNFEIAGFFEKDPEGDVEGGFVGQTAVSQEEIG